MQHQAIGPDRRCEVSADLATALEVVTGLGQRAQRMERDGVTRADVGQLADAGVLGARVSGRWAPSQSRELQEQLAAASGALWFVAAQHASPAEAAASTDNAGLRKRFAAGLTSGRLLGAVAFAHVRRPSATVMARPCAGGWSISGRLDWITSWGLADVLLLMAETEDGRIVQVLIPAEERRGLTITGELALAAMMGTSTVGADLDDMEVSENEVAAVVSKASWMSLDTQRTANVSPAVVGLARAAVNGLLEVADKRTWVELEMLAAVWREQLAADRARAYALIDETDPAEALDERLALRASITKLAQDATSMLIVAQAGRAMLTSSDAQRWAREAMFALVQAQTFASRNAIVDAYRSGAKGRAAP